MLTNGEAQLQRWALNIARAGGPVHVADVGANVGQWSRSLLATAADVGLGHELSLHAFEPNPAAFARLLEVAGGSATVSEVALSDRTGGATLHVFGPAAGINSLHAVPGMAHDQATVPTTTLDAYAAEHRIRDFALVKVDTEGHDLSVLRGARALLAGHRVSVVQFEYNHRWIYARTFLWDAFEFLGGLGYQIGKLTPRGIEFYPGWDPELETFVEGNYVACEPSVAAALPAVPWWKAPDG